MTRAGRGRTALARTEPRKTRGQKPVARKPSEVSGDRVELGDLADNLGYKIRRAQLWVFKDISRRLAPFDLGPAQFSVLSLIDANPGINQLTIASALSIERAGLGRLVDRLEQQGLVTRTASTVHRRYYILHLTTQGARLLNRTRPIIAEREKALEKKLGANLYKQLLQALSVFTHE